MKFTRAACWINSKVSNRDNSITLMILLCCHYCSSLLWCNYWRPLMLRNSTSRSRLKLTVQMKLSLYPCDPFLINSYNVTGNKVEKHCLVVLNVKLQVKLEFKTFYWILNCYILLSLWTPLSARLVFLEFLHILATRV